MNGYVLFECRDFRIVRPNAVGERWAILEVPDGEDATGTKRWRKPEGPLGVYETTQMLLAAFEAGRKHEYQRAKDEAARAASGER